jgi:hypothetical protein
VNTNEVPGLTIIASGVGAEPVVHTPLTHILPGWHALPQVPQLFVSLARFTQVLPKQLEKPPVHTVEATTMPPAGTACNIRFMMLRWKGVSGAMQEPLTATLPGGHSCVVS